MDEIGSDPGNRPYAGSIRGSVAAAVERSGGDAEVTDHRVGAAIKTWRSALADSRHCSRIRVSSASTVGASAPAAHTPARDHAHGQTTRCAWRRLSMAQDGT